MSRLWGVGADGFRNDRSTPYYPNLQRGLQGDRRVRRGRVLVGVLGFEAGGMGGGGDADGEAVSLAVGEGGGLIGEVDGYRGRAWGR